MKKIERLSQHAPLDLQKAMKRKSCFLERVCLCFLALQMIIITCFAVDGVAKPTAAFSADPTEGEAPLEVEITDQSTPS